MKLINSEDNKKTFQIKKDNYNIDFTLIDMGSFVGHRYRSAFASTPHYWETMFVDIINPNDKSKNINKENKMLFSFDSIITTVIQQIYA